MMVQGGQEQTGGSLWVEGKRILHVGKYYPPCRGGMEYFLRDLLQELDGRGRKVWALVHHHVPGGPLRVEANGGVEVWRVPIWGRLVYVPLSPRFFFHARRCLRSFRPHLLHLHMPNAAPFWFLGMRAARLVPWVIHWHADVVASAVDPRLRILYRAYRPLEQTVLKRARSVVVTSPPYLAHSRPLRPWARKCRVIPLGVDPQRLPEPEAEEREEAERSWGEAGHFRVLAVGRLTYYKGFEHLLEAVGGMEKVRLQIVGEGELKVSLGRQIRRLRAESRIKLRGDLPDSALRALFRTCHCLCLPSVERTEAFGVVLLEAMRYESPLVVSDLQGSGMGWIASQGPCGLLVPPGDPKALAEALGRLARAPEMGRDLGRRGREVFDSRFTIARVADQMEALYAELLV